jgi:asparagine synthase (glutamine-hydrolysing)
MSGLCGWFSDDPAALPIVDMAAPLRRFDNAPLRTGSHAAGAVALAAGLDCANLYHEDGLLIAMWGERVDGLARLWRSDGVKACAALSGAFAFALLDERKGEALLAIDRSGIRPLCYQMVGRTLVFASSDDALVQHPGVCREVGAQAIYDYLYFHAVPGPASIYKAHRRLLPGEFLHYHGGRLERSRYWKLQFHEASTLAVPALKDELVDTVRSAVQASLGQQKVGALLGAGGGSAAVTAMLGMVTGGPAQTYAVGFDVPGDRELERARVVARHFKTAHHEYRVSAADVADAIPKLAAVFDQPFANPSAVATFYASRMARGDGVMRLIGGAGGEQLFGAAERNARQARFGHYERIPSAVRQLLIEPLLFQLARGIDGSLMRRARSHIEQSLVPLPARLALGNLLDSYGSASVLEPGFLASVDPSAPLDALTQAWWLSEADSQVNQLIAIDMKYALADSELPQLVKGAELAGVETAFPLLGDAVVAFSARLAPRYKHDGVRERCLLLEALRELLPRQVRTNRPLAAVLPFGHWLQTDSRLRSLAFDSLSDLKSRRIVRSDFIDTLLTRHVPGHPAHHGTMVWTLLMLEHWFALRKTGGTLLPLSSRTEHEPKICRQ